MPLIAMRCTNCGGDIQLDDQKEYGFCMHCGSKVIIRDAEYKMQIELSGNVTFESNIENMLKSADGFLTLDRWDDAQRLYLKIIELDSKDYRAWWGMVKVCTQNFSVYTDKRHYEYYRSAIQVSDDDTKNSMEKEYRVYAQRVYDYTRLAVKFGNSNVKFDSAKNSFDITLSRYSRSTALVLCILLGMFGAHRFYTGFVGMGFLYFVTAGGFLSGWIVDIVRICRGIYRDRFGALLRSKKVNNIS